MNYELFLQGPEVYIPVLLISLVLTVLAYGAFPFILVRTRKKAITKKKFYLLCFGVNFLVMILFKLIGGSSSAAPYVLWTWIFARIGLNKLEGRGKRLFPENVTAESKSAKNASAVRNTPTTPRVDANQSNDDSTPEDLLRSIMAFQANETINAMKANAESQPNNENDADFGLVPEKPIFTLATMSVDGEKEYLNKLYTTDGNKITYTRRGSTSASGINGMIDIYDTHLPSGQFYKTIYIDMYGAKMSQSAPKGFSFSVNTKAPESVPVHHVDAKEDCANISNAKILCPKCNHVVLGNSEFCHFCGSKIEIEKPLSVTTVVTSEETTRSKINEPSAIVDTTSEEIKTENQTDSKKRRFKRIFKPIPCIIAAILLLVGAYLGTYLGARSHAKQGNWQNADQLLFIPALTKLHDPNLVSYIHAGNLLETDEYDSAIAEFEALGTYLDSETMVNEANYQLASDFLENGNFETALDIYLSLSDIGYRDSSDMYVKALHAKVSSLIEDGRYFGALNCLKSIENIQNHPVANETLTDLKRTLYQEGATLYFDGKYSLAADFFNSIPDYLDTCKFLLLIEARTTTNRFEIAEYYPQLLDIISFQDVEDIMLSSPYYRLFLQGRWENDRYYFTMDEDGTVWTNLPRNSGSFDYYTLKNGEYQNYNNGDSNSQYVTQFTFHIIDEDSIWLYCYYNEQAYFLDRVS